MKFNFLFSVVFIFLSTSVVPLYSLVYADNEHFTFAMPFSGEKGNKYELDLTFRDNQVKKFNIPQDCGQIINDVNYGMSNPINILDRKLWRKAINDCRYVMMVHQHEDVSPQTDFITGYDFYNARLTDLPFAQKCVAEDNEEFIQQCKKQQVEEGKLLIASYFPFLEIVKSDDSIMTEDCQFKNGLFRGRLIRTSDGIRCQPDRRANGLRLLSVDVGDFNSDGFLDALLRIMPIGRGVSRFPVLIPLTRFEENSSFSVCEGIAPELMSDF